MKNLIKIEPTSTTLNPFETGKFFLIVMDAEDDFLLEVMQDINRPNNPDNDELIASYMEDNYYGQTYKAIAVDTFASLDRKRI